MQLTRCTNFVVITFLIYYLIDYGIFQYHHLYEDIIENAIHVRMRFVVVGRWYGRQERASDWIGTGFTPMEGALADCDS